MAETILEILQREICAAESMSRVRHDTGLSYAIIHKLANGGDCHATTAQTLLDHFGYETVKKQRLKKAKKRAANKPAKKQARRKV